MTVFADHLYHNLVIAALIFILFAGGRCMAEIDEVNVREDDDPRNDRRD